MWLAARNSRNRWGQSVTSCAVTLLASHCCWQPLAMSSTAVDEISQLRGPMKMLKCLKSTCHGGQAFCFRDETARWSLCVTRATEQPITARLPLFNRPALIGVFIITMTLLQHFYFYLFTQIFRWKPLFWCRCLYKDNSTHVDIIETLTVASASKYKANLFIRKFHRSPQ